MIFRNGLIYPELRNAIRPKVQIGVTLNWAGRIVPLYQWPDGFRGIISGDKSVEIGDSPASVTPGMITTSIKMSAGIAGFGINSAALFRQNQMKRLGDFAIATVKARATKGIGSDDSPMPALSGKTSPILHNGKFVRQRIGYAGWKMAHGLYGVRDLVGTGKDGGHMWDGVSVRLATDSLVRMAFTTRTSRQKALANERRAPFFSFSDADEAKIVAYARQMFAAQVEVMRRELLTPGIRRAA